MTKEEFAKLLDKKLDEKFDEQLKLLVTKEEFATLLNEQLDEKLDQKLNEQMKHLVTKEDLANLLDEKLKYVAHSSDIKRLEYKLDKLFDQADKDIMDNRTRIKRLEEFTGIPEDWEQAVSSRSVG